MSISIKQSFQDWLTRHAKIKQWLWFVFLWVSGVVIVAALAYPLKLLMKTFT